MRVARSVVMVALVVAAAGCGAEPARPAPTANDDATSDTTTAAVVAPAAEPAPRVRHVDAAEVSDVAAATPPPRSRPRPAVASQYDRLGEVDVDWFGDPATCPTVGRAAVVDRANQMAWLCGDGRITREFPVTTARSQPDPGTYPVYAKDRDASSTISGAYSEMTHFVAFTYGKYQGARIAFHSVPTYRDGSYVQPLESVGTPELFGESAGCIRVLPDDAVAIWDWLATGDPVTVIS